MVEKISDLSTIQSVRDNNTRKLSRQNPNPLGLSSFNQISLIKHTEEVQRIVEPRNYQESYGLDIMKPKMTKMEKI